VLDFVRGSGCGCALSSEHAEAAIGIDLSKTAIEFARRRYDDNGPQFFEANLKHSEAIGFLEHKFEFIVSFDVIDPDSEQIPKTIELATAT
jgi:methylase of polypeptide subunit release factors